MLRVEVTRAKLVGLHAPADVEHLRARVRARVRIRVRAGLGRGPPCSQHLDRAREGVAVHSRIRGAGPVPCDARPRTVHVPREDLHHSTEPLEQVLRSRVGVAVRVKGHGVVSPAEGRGKPREGGEGFASVVRVDGYE